jgi:N-acetylglucosamine-6-phosphate deacetylase
METALTNLIFFEAQKEVKDQAILIQDDKIKAIVSENEVPTDARIVDCNSCYLSPGLVDLQIYGAGGYLFSNNPSAESLHAIANAIVKTGTTSFMLTLATNSMEILRQAIEVVKNNPHPAVAGLHFEGPYINPLKKGAHLEQYIKKPDLKEVQALLDEAEGVIKMMTLAPEVCDPGVIKLLLDNNVIVSAGHSNATYEEAKKGFDLGVQTTTHLFNAMSPFHHRDTGLPGATFLSNAYTSIIADGIHVDYETITISKKIMGERLFLITDAVEENLEGVYVHVAQKDRFNLPDGTLSGSKLSLLQAVKNCVQHAGIALPEALRMASEYPARLSGRKEDLLASGAKANLLLFDSNFKVSKVILEGQVVR